MIKITTKPKKSLTKCPKCKIKGEHRRFIFQGIHTSEKFFCKKCQNKYIFDLKIGHSLNYEFGYSPNTKFTWIKRSGAYSWFAKPYIHALNSPNKKKIKIEKISRKKIKKPLILNCIDYLYGHSLLKLFNIERHLKDNPSYDLILIIPKSLLWLVPDGVAEILIVDMNFSQAKNYYTSLDRQISKYISNYETVFLSKAYAHPKISDISFYTRQKSCVKTKNQRITFIWRSDRPWFNNIYITHIFKKLKIVNLLNYLQYIKIIRLFKMIKASNSHHTYTVAGFDKKFQFPSWIDDKRVNTFTPKEEKKLCAVYAESKIVIGTHGSNMLLPSAHAEMILDIMPDDRLGNFAQDIIYETKRYKDPRLTSFFYRYAFLNNSISTITKITNSMIKYSEEVTKLYSKNN